MVLQPAADVAGQCYRAVAGVRGDLEVVSKQPVAVQRALNQVGDVGCFFLSRGSKSNSALTAPRMSFVFVDMAWSP